MRTLLLLQLGFNILMLAALIGLARQGRKPTEKPAKTKGRGKLLTVRETAAMTAPPPSAAPTNGPLGEWIERVDARELAAEAALRARLARYGQRVD